MRKRVDYYMDEIDSIMAGRCDGRMSIYYLDAIKNASQNDRTLSWDDVTRIQVQVTALQELLERYNPWARRVVGSKEVISCA